jgi:lipid A 3-O-deacylase
VFTYAGAGASFRLGHDMGEDFGVGGIEPTVVMAGANHPWEAYLLGRVKARYVLHNLFLDGGWFRAAQHTVERREIVVDTELGATVRYRGFVVGIRWVRRSPEFRERRVYQNYGAINLAVILGGP